MIYVSDISLFFKCSLFFGLAGQLINSIAEHDGISRQSHDRVIDEEVPAAKPEKEQV